LPGYSFELSVKWEEIFVFCLSGSFNDHLREQFGAVACVEINDIAAFCKRVEIALPPRASFPENRGRRRIGCWVEYYDEGEGGTLVGRYPIGSPPRSPNAIPGRTSSAWFSALQTLWRSRMRTLGWCMERVRNCYRLPTTIRLRLRLQIFETSVSFITFELEQAAMPLLREP
jgi:hypothetical protein